MMNKNIYNNGYPYIQPNPDTKEAELWPSWSLVQKISWNWNTKISIIRSYYINIYRIEDFWKGTIDFWNSFWNQLGVSVQITSSFYDILCSAKINKTTHNYFPPYSEWSTKDKNDFWAICGDNMAKLGYI